MLPVPEIDSVYYTIDEQITANQTQLKKGVSIYLNSKPFLRDVYYLRWDYEDTWQFSVPDTVRYVYINSRNILPLPVGEIREFCWKSGKPTEILVRKIIPDDSEAAIKQQIKFIVPDESGGDIFDPVPFEVLNNIKNVNDPAEKVLGCFQVSAVSKKRIFIDYSDVAPYALQGYINDCPSFLFRPDPGILSCLWFLHILPVQIVNYPEHL